jgi:uncharacterized protein (DUF2252 family)
MRLSRMGAGQVVRLSEAMSEIERAADGRARRAEVPRRSHAQVEFPPGRDPLGILERQAATRVAELVPIRYGRMLASPFAFFRGAAAVMAEDLASTPAAGLDVQLCGDAHLLNFGWFGSPERSLVFDVNDFDETLRGPFEWDVKRLAASIEVAGRDRDFGASDRRAAVLAAVGMYREAMRRFASMRNLDLWYARIDAEMLVARIRTGTELKQLRRGRNKALANDSMRALGKLTHLVDGEPRIISDPPLIEPIADLVARHEATVDVSSAMEAAIAKYRQSLQSDRRELLQGYRYIDLARKVVGIGSVGTRSWIVLLLGRDDTDPLFLQVKEAEASVLERPESAAPWPNHGQRVVEGQRLMQATSDIFLGWLDVDAAIDGTAARDYYVRQLWDWKAAMDVRAVRPTGFTLYAQACGWTLARAHARSGDRIAIASYLGRGDGFDHAVADFADTYAERNKRDRAALGKAVKEGRIVADETA